MVERCRSRYRVIVVAALFSVLAGCDRPEPAGSKEAAPGAPAQARDEKPAAGGLLQGAKDGGAATAPAARPPVVELATPQSVSVGTVDPVTFVVFRGESTELPLRLL